jgi:hypothetical protein
MKKTQTVYTVKYNNLTLDKKQKNRGINIRKSIINYNN